MIYYYKLIYSLIVFEMKIFERLRDFTLYHLYLLSLLFYRYSFKCKGRDDRGGKLIFQLEICSVPGLQTVVGMYVVVYTVP